MGNADLPPREARFGTFVEAVAECDGFEIFYREYGHRDRPAVLALHGLGGQGWNNHRLATALQRSYRVICPDLIGRGRSQWSSDPQRDYCNERYQAILGRLLEKLMIEDLAWVGTSMGGAIGMYCAGGEWRDRVTCLVLNDVGPELPAQIVEDIAAAAGASPEFAGYRALADHLARFLGELSGQAADSEHWLRFALAGGRRTDAGNVTLHHDPQVASQLRHHPEDYALWDRYDRIRCPTLVLRGDLSSVLTREVAQGMTARGPLAQLVTLDGWGHAPFLEEGQQIRLVSDFLERHHA